VSQCLAVPANRNINVDRFKYCELINNVKPAIIIWSFITGGPAGVVAYKQPKYRVLILADEYHLSISAAFWLYGLC
jgi:hypothetical protein